MAFSSVFQFTPGDGPGMNRWLLEHYLEHMAFYRALLAQSPSVITVNYPIQRMEDQRDWLAAHNKMSQSVWTGVGGGESTDFGDLDWSDATKVQDWMNIHALWHKRVRDSLGL
jgi:hypothetical protein